LNAHKKVHEGRACEELSSSELATLFGKTLPQISATALVRMGWEALNGNVLEGFERDIRILEKVTMGMLRVQ
jgi:hypothetical protein